MVQLLKTTKKTSQGALPKWSCHRRCYKCPWESTCFHAQGNCWQQRKTKQNQYNSEILYISPVCFIQMPRIWIDYCQFLVDYSRITKTRRTFDRALRALPITQHHRIWPRYLKFVRLYDLPETAIRVYRRHLKVEMNYFVY